MIIIIIIIIIFHFFVSFHVFFLCVSVYFIFDGVNFCPFKILTPLNFILFLVPDFFIADDKVSAVHKVSLYHNPYM